MREPFAPETWSRLSRHLDELLDLDPVARGRQLTRLRAEEPALAERLETMLAAAETESPVLDRPLGALAGQLLGEGMTTHASDGGAADGEVRRIGPWQLGRRLGRGGMGTVHEAVRADGQYDQKVALKLLDRLDYSGDLARRLDNERRILARLDHPGIARLLDGGLTEAGSPWFAMEFVDGVSVTEHCDRMALTIGRRVDLFLSICEAAAYAHQHLIVHRDLKPSNILVTADGKVKLVDFGIAKVLAGEWTEAVAMTRTGDRVMTPRYAAPEQIRGEPVTTATDVHALGIVLYELLTGRTPFGDADSSGLEVEQAVLRQDPLPPARAVLRPLRARNAAGETVVTEPGVISSARGASTRRLRQELGGDLGTIIGKALSKDPATRYGSAEALRADLERWREGMPIRAHRPSVRYRLGKYLRRHRVEMVGSGLIIFLLAGGLAGTTWQARKASRNAQRAERSLAFLIDMFSAADPARTRGREITVREALEQGVARITTDLQDEPRLAAELMFTVGGAYQQLGYYVLADSVLGDALLRTEASFGPDSYEWARVANVRGNGLLELGRLDEAEALFVRSRSIAERSGGTHDVEALAALANLGAVARRRGHGPEAVVLFKQVLDTSEKALGPDYQGRDQDLNNLAVALGDVGRLAEADSVHGLALVLRERIYGPVHPYVAVTLHNLAETKAYQGSTAEAESLWTRSIEMRRLLYPQGHSDLAASLTSFAGHLRDYGHLAPAAALLEEAVAMHRAINPAPTQELARTLNSLGTLAYSQGDLEGATGWLTAARDAWRATFGAESPAALTTMNNLAVILHRSGRLDEARPLFEEVLATRLRLLEPEDPSLAFSRKGLGMLRLDEGHPQEAAELLVQALAVLQNRYEGGATVVAEVQLGLGECHFAAGRFAVAESLVTAAQISLRAGFAEDHPMVQRARSVLQRLHDHPR